MNIPNKNFFDGMSDGFRGIFLGYGSKSLIDRSQDRKARVEARNTNFVCNKDRKEKGVRNNFIRHSLEDNVSEKKIKGTLIDAGLADDLTKINLEIMPRSWDQKLQDIGSFVAPLDRDPFQFKVQIEETEKSFFLSKKFGGRFSYISLNPSSKFTYPILKQHQEISSDQSHLISYFPPDFSNTALGYFVQFWVCYSALAASTNIFYGFIKEQVLARTDLFQRIFKKDFETNQKIEAASILYLMEKNFLKLAEGKILLGKKVKLKEEEIDFLVEKEENRFKYFHDLYLFFKNKI